MATRTTVTPGRVITGLVGWAIFAIQPVQADNTPLIHQQQQQAQRPAVNSPSVGLAVPFSDHQAQQAATLDDQAQRRQQERQQALQQQQTPETDVRLTRPGVHVSDYPADEQPCFTIHTLRLEGDAARRFQWALDTAADAKGRCLGGQGILLVSNQVQNAILAKGYVTTRVMVQEQDLTQGVLTLTLQPGRIADIRFEEPVSWRGRLWNAMPAASGDILNLRDIEQALENFKRVPSAEADIKIVPGQQEATSDLLVSWKAGRPIRLSLGLDDSGAKSTGRYLGSATLAIDAPFAQNDLFYANIGKDLFDYGPFGNRSRTVNYLFPLGYWTFSANYNDYTYHQNIANANEILAYSGRSENVQFTVSRLLFRNQLHKTTLNMRVFRRHSTNAVGDIEIEQQHRRTAGWELGLSQRSYLGNATLDASLNWRRGTGAFGALPAPEEADHRGSARTGMVLGDISLNVPFHWGKQPWRYYTKLRGQWSANPLTPQDRMAIAGRYTVRGFDGEQSLSGERGLLWRHELAWNVLSRGHELYWALDYGRVDGPGTRYLVGHQLAGGALGVRGTLWRRLSYDLFAGVPFYKPAGFHTAVSIRSSHLALPTNTKNGGFLTERII
ncbi:putative hemolysin activation protein HecB [Xenorhabdus beddingii]|uniref:Putative hemolysin activation protein HecB n=1 Tax=Xenorhabdus beddingii TaxID=40578 RepID=A0A1Y2SLZ4_9GAMM|nr:ShlB/FhaC/HecB family hemolysin secretion/activation protein [Xenorhabdus beddingii]OTA19819.1 putative hemolysin activation protein HecB [Xenorhabdus beddingii]